MKPKPQRVSFYIPVVDVIDDANPPVYLSCDWLRDPLAFGLIYFPVWVYEKLRSLQNANSGS